MQRDSEGRALQQLYEAVLLLASEEGRIEGRLALAYFKHIQPIEVTEFPPDGQSRLESIRARLRKLYPIQGGVDSIDRDTAVNLAMEIILLYDDLNS